MINSRLDQFSAAPSCYISINFTLTGHPLSLSYGVILPSSLARVLSRALGFSPYLPVSVCGTGTYNLVRGFSRQHGINHFVTNLHSTSRLSLHKSRICLTLSLLACTHSTNGALCLPFCVTPSLNDYRWYWNINQLSIAYALRLGLGPDLPWADEPSPGILRFTAREILTPFIAYSYRHSHLYAVQHSSRYTFNPHTTLPYRWYKIPSRSFGGVFEPRYIFGAESLD